MDKMALKKVSALKFSIFVRLFIFTDLKKKFIDDIYYKCRLHLSAKFKINS